MTVTIDDVFDEFGLAHGPDSALTREQVIERNLKVVAAHFHSENPDDVEKAVALYDDDITWEAPSRGIVWKDRDEILAGYRDIFRAVVYHKTIALRRFATETFVFDDQVNWATIVDDPALIPNMPFAKGTDVCVRLVHCFQMRDGRITREIAYELWREAGSVIAHDDIPADAVVELFPGPPH